MIAELMEAKQDVESFKLAIFMAAGVNNEVAMDMRIGVLPKLTEKVDKIQRNIDDLVKTHHILFETPFYEKAYILLFRDGKTIVKTYDLHECKYKQDWALTRSKERFDEAKDSDDEGYYWAIVRYDYHLGSVDIASTWICHFALTPAEGNSLFKQLNDWQKERIADSPNYIYLPDL
jgi:spermidine synthase